MLETRLLLALSAAVIASAALAGCNAEADESQAAQPATPAPQFIFYDGEPISPTKWAGAPPAAERGEALGLLASLQIEEVVSLKRKRGVIESEIAAIPELSEDEETIQALEEFDYTPRLLEDIDRLKALGRQASIPVQWTGDRRDEDGEYRDNVVLPDGREVQGMSLALYLNAIAAAAREGKLLEHEADHELSNSLLMIGYNIYNSDTAIESHSPRMFIQSSAWYAAFCLREHHARARGDEAEAELWKQRWEQEQREAFTHMRSEYRRKRVGG